jgi:hypothetical protein
MSNKKQKYTKRDFDRFLKFTKLRKKDFFEMLGGNTPLFCPPKCPPNLQSGEFNCNDFEDKECWQNFFEENLEE